MRLKTTSEVFHVWAHQGQSEGKCSSVSFDGKTLYSYAEPIAIIAENPAGEKCVLITSQRFSVTTSGHTVSALYATSHMRRFHVPTISCSHTLIRQHIADAVERMARQIPEARTRPGKAKRYQELRSYIASKNEFCSFFGLEPFAEIPPDGDMEAYLAAIAEKRAQEDKARAERFAKEQAKRLRESKRLLKDWKAGRIGGYFGGLPTHYMRVKGTDHIETTLGAVVPLASVRRFAPRILEVVRAGKEWEPDRTIMFGHYSLDRIDAKGTVHVGCHRFDRKEIERVAGLIMEPAIA